MPIIHRPSDKRINSQIAKDNVHECKPPSRDFSHTYHGWRSDEEEGAVWACPECGDYFVSVNKNNMIHSNIWREVRWYHFSARKAIADYEYEDTTSTGNWERA